MTKHNKTIVDIWSNGFQKVFSFEYTVDGVKYYVNYNWDENCKFTFTYIDENGRTTNLPHNGSLADNSSENSESHINQDACKDVVYNSG